MAGLTTKSVLIAAFNRLDLTSLGDVQGLASIWLWDQAAVPSLEFVGRCRNLRSLTVDVARVAASDWNELVDHPTLERAWFASGLTDDLAEDVAVKNPRLAIANGSIYYYKGRRVSKQDWFLLVRERDSGFAGDALGRAL